MDLIANEIEEYAREHSSKESDVLKQIRVATHAELEWPGMLSGPLVGQFLGLLINLTGSLRVLEIGTFSGYGSLSMAEKITDAGKLTTLEVSDENADFAQKYFDMSPHGNKIEIIRGPAIESLKYINDTFDLVFIDADKKNYPAYYKAAFARLRPGGLILIDNCLWSGQVLAPEDDYTRAIHELNEIITADIRVQHVLLTLRDGLHMVHKISD